MIAHTCRRCGSAALRKNGRAPTGQQKFHCKDCNFYGTLDTKEHERSAHQAVACKLHTERLSQRAIARTTDISRMTIAKAIKKVVVPIGQTIEPLRERPILELDELWSFVAKRGQKVWIGSIRSQLTV